MTNSAAATRAAFGRRMRRLLVVSLLIGTSPQRAWAGAYLERTAGWSPGGDSNDVRIASVSITNIRDDVYAFEGDTTTFDGRSHLTPGASSSCDIVTTDEAVPVCSSNADCESTSDDSNICTDAVCDPTGPGADAFGCVHVNNAASCDDDDPCTTDDCSVASGCIHTYTCDGTDICRTADYWSMHGGYGKPNSINVTQSVLDAIGGVAICGTNVTKTSNLDSPYLESLGRSSALEGLCVRGDGERVRQLYRQLLATALNCAMSGAPNCDDVVLKYIEVAWSDCDRLCENGVENMGGPTVQQCVQQLDCFNSGGTMYEGKCATGYCESNPGLACGGGSGKCPGGPRDCQPLPHTPIASLHSNAE